MRNTVRTVRLLAGSVLLVLPLLLHAADEGSGTAAVTDRPDIAYLREVNAWRPPENSQLLFLLMSQYANAGRHLEGAAYIDELRRRFDPRLDNIQRALYLTAIASLRAGGANQVPLLQRFSWVRDTLAMLDQATQLTGGQAFITHWMSGIVRAQLPSIFGEAEKAEADLRWCLQNAEKMPHSGWLREVHFQLSRLERKRGNTEAAQRELAASGYGRQDKSFVLNTPYTEDHVKGHAFASKDVREIVPGSVYLVTGYEFTEYYFIISANRRELISIDAGTSTDAAREAFEALRAKLGTLPPLTTVLVTHAHWDHVGGQRYFRSMNPAPRFIGHHNYTEELAIDNTGDATAARPFFGGRFNLGHVLEYKPDQTIDRPTTLTIGGTRIDLLPTRGSETNDAMLIHLPEQDIAFVGDIMMPYFGSPFVNEGSIDGMLAAIEQLKTLKPKKLLHGHEPLTAVFGSLETLKGLAPQIAWLRDAVVSEMRRGTERGAIQQANLMPPMLEQASSSVHLAYLVMRENMINRIYKQNSGYWLPGLRGMDVLTDADRGRALIDYIGTSEKQIVQAVEKMLSEGHHELAAETLRVAQTRIKSERLDVLRREAYAKLMEQYQNFNPFKFIVYAAQAEQTLPPVNSTVP